MLKKIQKIIFFLVAIYAVLGFIVLPIILKSQLVDIVEKETNAKISVESISFNPFIFKLKLNGIELKDAEDAHLLSLKSFSVNLELYSLFRSALHIKNLLLEEPKISLIYKKNKSLNFASIVKQSTQKTEDVKSDSDDQMPRIIVDRVAIVDGGINYEDYTHKTKFDFSFDSIGFELRDIDTADLNSSDATIRFYTALGDGGFFDLKSEVLGLKPFEIKGSVDFEASKLYTEWKYMQDALNLEVADGKINFNAQYYFNLDDLNATSIDNLNASISKLRIKPKDKYKDVLNLEHFSLNNVTVKPMQQAVHVSSIALDSLHVKVKRDTSAQIDWMEYIKTDFGESAEQNSTVKSEPSLPWNVIVDDISLQKIKVDFSDEGVKPSVSTKLNDMNISIKNLTLAGVEPLLYRVNLRLNEEFVCSSDGDVKHKFLDLNSYIKCSGFDIVRFRPYIDEVARDTLSVYDVKLQQATFGFDANVSTLEVQEQVEVSVNNANFNLSKFALDKKSTQERLLDFSDFDINGLSLSTKDRALNIKKVALDSLNVQTGLYEDGSLNLENLIVVKEKQNSEKTKDKEIKEESYRVQLKHFALESAKVSFDDKTLKPSLKTKIDKININAYNIDSNSDSWLDYDLSLRLNSKGYAKSNGKIRHTPVSQKGRFDLEKISLQEFSPYIQKSAYIRLDDGYINLKTKTEYAQSDTEADIKISGNLDVDEFFLHDSRDNSPLLSFNNLTLKSFNYEMFPNRAYVNEVDLDGFYVNALIDKNKNMNLASLSKSQSDANTSQSEDANTSQFPFKIMKLNVASGSAKFADLSLPLEFKTDIHDLNGVVYSISSESGEVSYVDIKGEVDKYGSTKLIGSIDSSNPKLYTDLDFNFRNLELNSLSGYSASFAGYKMDGGKLFLDLGYKILDSDLLGKNSIIIKKIKLGDEIEDENSSSLPLGFVIALLEDSDGVIDIDMPIEGDVDAPDFKYGALVWKTLGNLILKAVASPFKFLGSMMGIDGEKLEFVEFEAGVATILPPEKEKLDNIAKLMIKRPKILLNIIGQYDEKEDAWVLKQQKLVAKIMKKSGLKNKKDYQTAMNIDLLKEIYKELAPKKKPETIETMLKKTYKDEALKIAYLKALVIECTQMQVVTLKELQALANKRAELLKEYLLVQKSVETQRVVLQEVQIVEDETDKWVRTKLEIDVK